MSAPHRSIQLNVAVAASAVVAALLIYAGYTTARGRDVATSRPTAAAPVERSFAKIGVGACAESNVETAAPVVTEPSTASCDARIGHASDIASLSLDRTRGEASSYRW